MARRSFDDETLAWVREMPLSQVLDKLRDDGQLFWRRDPDFVPEKGSSQNTENKARYAVTLPTTPTRTISRQRLVWLSPSSTHRST